MSCHFHCNRRPILPSQPQRSRRSVFWDSRLTSRVGVPSSSLKVPVLFPLCLRAKSLGYCTDLHAQNVRNGVELDGILGGSLVNALVMCGNPSGALYVVSGHTHTTVSKLTVLITQCSRTGQYDRLLWVYRKMLAEGLEPNEYILVNVLKACANLANLEEGKRAHAESVKRGFASNSFLSNALIAMYINCGRVADANLVFDRMPEHDLVTWNTMIAGYAKNDLSKEAVQLYIRMQEQGVPPDARTFVALLQACAAIAVLETDACKDLQTLKVGALQLGKCVHAEVCRTGFLPNEFICSSLVHLYATCGSFIDARRICDVLCQCKVASWTAMIAALAHQEHGGSALELYLQMQYEGVTPNDRTFVSVLKGCGSAAAGEGGALVNGCTVKVVSLDLGKKIHAEVCRSGYATDMYVTSCLVSMYANCGSLLDAEIVFDSLAWPDVVSWTAMITACAQQGQAERALQLYEHMIGSGVRPNNWTLASVLKACANSASRDENSLDAQAVKYAVLCKGKILHAVIVECGYELEGFVGNALVHMYASCGSPLDALHVFTAVSTRDVVSWTAMIGAYAQDEQDMAWQLYMQMNKESVKPNEATFLCILKACSMSGCLQRCSQIHKAIVESGVVCSENLVTALIHAYAKCGDIIAAQTLFDSLPLPDVVSWTALIAGYARAGDTQRSLQLYSKMQEANIQPNGLTLISILAACSHTGLVQKGMECFRSMTKDHGIFATAEHYACLVDLLCRAGMFDKVQDLLSEMREQQDLAVWSSLLGSCRNHLLDVGR